MLSGHFLKGAFYAITSFCLLLCTATGSRAQSAVTGSVLSLETTMAVVEATINPAGLVIQSIAFEYGTTTGYGQSAAATPAQVYAPATRQVSGFLTGLAQDTTYHYRVAVTTTTGMLYGADRTFTTTVSPARYTESFELPVFPPPNWLRVLAVNGSNWSRLAKGTDPLPGWAAGDWSQTPVDIGAYSAYCTWGGSVPYVNDQWLITPLIRNVQAGDDFSLSIGRAFERYADKIDILLSTTTNQTTSFTTTLELIDYPKTVTVPYLEDHLYHDMIYWETKSYDLSAYAGQNVYIAIREHFADNTWDGKAILVDLVEFPTLNTAPFFTANTTYKAQPPLTVTFQNTTTDKRMENFYWNFGDGTTSVELDPSHTYSTRGYYTVTLSRSDKDGLALVRRNFINVGMQPPATTGIANVQVPVHAGTSAIDLLQSFDDNLDAPASLAYTISGNTNPALFSSAVITDGFLFLTYTPCAVGAAAITVRATDSDGLFTETTFTVQVANSAPTTSGIPALQAPQYTQGSVLNLHEYFDDAEDGPGQLTYALTANSNPGLFAVAECAAGGLMLVSEYGATGSSTLTIEATDICGLTVSSIFTVTIAPCDYSLSAPGADFAADGGDGSFDIAASDPVCFWSASTSSDWLNLTSSYSGTGSATVAFTAAANPGPARSGSIAAAGLTFTVQQASGCVFSITPDNDTYAAEGGYGAVAVAAGPGCQWDAVSSVDWLTIISDNSSSGEGDVYYTVAENTGPARSGALSVAGKSFIVNQEAGCIDADGDGYGLGDTCAGPDCDDNNSAVHENCPTCAVTFFPGAMSKLAALLTDLSAIIIRGDADAGFTFTTAVDWGGAGIETLIKVPIGKRIIIALLLVNGRVMQPGDAYTVRVGSCAGELLVKF